MECWTRSRCYGLDRLLFGAATRGRGFLLLTRGIHLKDAYGIVQGTDPFIPEKLLQGDEIWFLYLVFQELEPVHGGPSIQAETPMQAPYQLFPMHSHSSWSRCLCSSGRDSMYSDRENGMALRRCTPTEIDEDDVAVIPDEFVALTFAFLAGGPDSLSFCEP